MNNVKKYTDLVRIPPRQERAGFLRLDMNENPEGLPKDFVSKVMSQITPEYIAMYPEPDKLRKILAGYLDVNMDQILITNGSDEALDIIFEVFGDKEKKVVSVNPTFAMYNVYSKMAEMENVTISYKEDFTVDIKEILDKIDEDTAIVSLLNPNNPIGSVYSVEDVREIIKKAQSVGAIVIIDEAYHYFYSNTFLEECKTNNNVILVRTFSKLCSIAGLRIGFVVSSPEIVKVLFNAKETFNVNTIGLKFAEEIIGDKELIPALIEIEKDGRQYVVEQLKERNIPYYAQNGNYVFIYCGDNAKKVVELLEKNKVLVKFYENNPMLNKYIRISTGSRKIMEEFMAKFDSVRAGA